MMGNRQTALITGATSGIGFAFAQILNEQGFNLVLAGRSEDKLKQTRSALTGNDSSITLIQSDLAEIGAARTLHQQCTSQKLIIDLLINNAGVGLFGEQAVLPLEEVEKMIILNVISVTELCSLFGNEMKQRRAGYILNIASTAAYQPLPRMAAYGGTKSYVLNFSEALTKELEDYNVLVSCLSPGPTDTNFFSQAKIKENAQGFFSGKNRMTAREVADYGLKCLFSKKISSIPGLKNKILANSNRWAPRSIVAAISKKFTQQS